ncbi:hypothetical protein ACWNYQ_00175 [Candidatus Vidania fulgoroideorum]
MKNKIKRLIIKKKIKNYLKILKKDKSKISFFYKFLDKNKKLIKKNKIKNLKKKSSKIGDRGI